METLDSRLFRDVNHFARQTPALHELGRLGAAWLPLLALLACVAAAWGRGRRRADAPVAVASALWAALGTALAWAVARPLAVAVGRPRPYRALPGVEVLVHRVSAPGLPDAVVAALAAGAVAFWFRDRALAAVATGAALLGSLGQVYVGLAYPGDVVAGLALGAVVGGGARPLGLLVLSWLTVKVERSPLHLLVAAHRA